MKRSLLTLCLAPLLLAACGQDTAPAADPPPAQAPAAGPAPGTAAAADPLAAPLQSYSAAATALLGLLEAEPVDIAAAAEAAAALTRQGADLVPAFVQRHPRCQPYLEAALVVVEGWRDMDLEAMEADYHDDGALPEVEDAAACYHAKDLFVHPATVELILSMDTPDLAQARHEIREVIAHAHVSGLL